MAQKSLLFRFQVFFFKGIGVRKMRKTITLALLTILAISSFSIVLSVATGDTSIDKTWYRMHGVITKWGEKPILGHIRADAFSGNINGTLREWAKVFAMWTNRTFELEDRDMVRQPIEPNAMFGVQFYVARLTNFTEIRFDLPEYELYVKGKWTVLNITTSVTTDALSHPVNITRTFEPIVTDAVGELKVYNVTTGILKTFELKIDGIDILTGNVFRNMLYHWEIKFFDVDGDGIVDIRDLVKTAKRYKAVPGMMGYAIDYDVNGNGMIDIGSLTTIAANIEG